MSAQLPISAETVPTPIQNNLPRWLSEPLLHFVILGAILFGIDRWVARGADDAHSIVVTAEVDNDATQLFKASRGREPNPTELAALRQVWLDNEVLYREGLALQLDRGDVAIRERVIFKALSVVDSNVKLPDVDDAALRSWFENHRDKYDEPARYSFEEAVLSGDMTEGAVRSFVVALNAGTPSDAQAGLRVFKDRPESNLVQSYGANFGRELEALRPGEWRALQTRDGWRAIHATAVTPARPAVYESYRGVVLQDWKDATASEQRTAAVRELAKKYKVSIEAQEASR